jgi:hypothetical protein
LAAETPPGIELATTVENPADGADVGQLSHPALLQCPVHGHGTEFPQVAFLTQLLSGLENQRFHARRGTIARWDSAAGPITPVDPIQTLSSDAVNPALHRVKTHAKIASYRALTFTTTDRSYHRTPLLFLSRFCAIAGSS